MVNTYKKDAIIRLWNRWNRCWSGKYSFPSVYSPL